MTKGKYTIWKINDNDKTYNNLKVQLAKKHLSSINQNKYYKFNLEELTEDKVKINNSIVRFTHYKCKYMTSISPEKWSNFSLLLYQCNTTTGFIVEKNSDALTLLRQICGYSKKEVKTIENVFNNSQKFYADFFMWVVNKIYQNNPKLTFKDSMGNNIDISLDSLDSLKGLTRSVNHVSTNGTDITKMLTTLGFLMESTKLSEVSIDIAYSNHKNISFEMTTGTIVCIKNEIDSYTGTFTNNLVANDVNENDLAIINDKLIILLSFEIIPNLIHLFNKDGAQDVRRDLTKKIIYTDLPANIKNIKDKYHLNETIKI